MVAAEGSGSEPGSANSAVRFLDTLCMHLLASIELVSRLAASIECCFKFISDFR